MIRGVGTSLKRVSWWTWAIVVLMIIRSVVIWYGFDRLPLLSNGEEAAQNDQAVNWSRGLGLFGRSYAGLLQTEGFFAHHMPVYIVSQAALYRILGFSVLTLRGSSIVYFLAATAVILVLLVRLTRAGLVRAPLAFVIAAVYLWEPTAMLEVRMGRNDTMTALFGSCACFLLLPQRGKFVRRSIAAAVFAGLSIATHPAGILFVCILFAVLVAEPLSWRLRAGIGALPFVMAAVIWVAVYHGKSWQAFTQLRMWAAESATMDVTAPALLRALMGRDVQGFVHQGGILFSLLIAALVAAALILGNSLRYGTYKGNYVSFLALATLSQGLFLFLYLGTQTTRLIVVLPWLMIWLAIALSRLPIEFQSPAVTATALLACIEAGILIGTCFKIKREYALRSPDRFASFISTLQKGESVAADRELWFALQKDRVPFRIINFGLPYDRRYWMSNPKRFDSYDVIIMRPDQRKIANAAPNRTMVPVRFGEDDFVVLRRP